MNELNRRLAGILAADVVAYSRMIGTDEARTLARVRKLRIDIIEPLAQAHGGKVFKTTGDGFFAAFASAVQALRCALAIQETLRERDDGLLLRIGVHQGEVVPDGDDLLGDGVIVASRLEGVAQPGGVAISGRVREDVAGKLQLELEDLGSVELKNIAGTVRVYRIQASSKRKELLQLPSKPSIVVLPFLNMSDDPEQEYFSDGMVEDITSALSRITSLFVIARNSAFTYKGRAVDVRQVGQELGVRYVLEGSVRRSGKRLRVTGQLVDALTGVHLWADNFDGVLDEIFELQDQVAASVSGVIEPRLQRAEIERAQRKPTQDLGAYDYYLRGMAVFNQAVPERLIDAQTLFLHAVSLDSDYAASYGMAAVSILFRRANYLVDQDSPEIVEAVRLARHAATLGRDDPIALWSAGLVIAYFDSAEAGTRLNAGARLVERSCTLNPNSAMSWNCAGYINVYRGMYLVAIGNFEKAMRLSPVDPLLHLFQFGMSMASFCLGRYDEAITWAEQAVSERPAHTPPLRLLASALALSGRLDEARCVMVEVLRVAPQTRLSDVQTHLRQIFRITRDADTFVDGFRLAGMPE